jgi:hypothetical protein
LNSVGRKIEMRTQTTEATREEYGEARRALADGLLRGSEFGEANRPAYKWLQRLGEAEDDSEERKYARNLAILIRLQAIRISIYSKKLDALFRCGNETKQ